MVASLTSEARPPMTPPMPETAEASATTVVPSARERSTPSSVTSRSPARARRTMSAGPATRARS
ncbi:MAG: hypothetical protein DMD43_07325 [Gemmatimonadetes bacterium]|nr:MAG: hypothetical protein DMD43_07325 [Gemmatimonadota bacterium]